jgi:RNA-directed DNA polymerase
MGPHTSLTPIAVPGEIPVLLTREDVASLVGLQLWQLTWWVWALNPHRRYDHFNIRRSDGSRRAISAPIKPIKDIQRCIATVLSATYEPPAHVHGFTTGRSPLTNAREHVRQRWVLRVDLEDFFPSINFGRVRGLFMAPPYEYPPDVATLLAQICCHENELPQGAPSSPIISNLICRGMDRELARLAKAERCRFTRYADDLCFSTDRNAFPPALAVWASPGVAQAGQTLQQIIMRNGFRVNAMKTRLTRDAQRQRVTGLVVNAKANAPADYVRSLRSLLYIWKRFGEAEASAAFLRAENLRNRPPDKPLSTFRAMVRGRVQYVGSVKGWSNPIYRRLAFQLQDVDPNFRPRTLLSLHSAQAVRIYTEGESDFVHFLAAQSYFHGRGEFQDLRLETTADAAAGGDQGLLRKCNGLALTKQTTPCICIFDGDDPKAVRDAVGASLFKDYGNGVGAAVIVPPEWRDGPVCIEMLYTDADLERRTLDGRRLYLSQEFHPRTGHHESEPVHVPHAGGRTLVREEVLAFEGADSIGLSKLAFARAVSEGGDGFSGVDFDGFRSTFEVIEEAVIRVMTTQ